MSARAEAGASTRDRIIAVARKLFATRGYEATSTENVLEVSGISRGALYHHFENKQALFAAVLEAVEAEVARRTGEATAGIDDPIEALHAGFDAFLELASTDVEVRQIVLIDAHSVVGWEKWREIDNRHGFGRIKQALKKAAERGRVRGDMVDTYAHVLLASVIELAFVIARSERADAAVGQGRTAMRDLVDRLLNK